MSKTELYSKDLIGMFGNLFDKVPDLKVLPLYAYGRENDGSKHERFLDDPQFGYFNFDRNYMMMESERKYMTMVDTGWYFDKQALDKVADIIKSSKDDYDDEEFFFRSEVISLYGGDDSGIHILSIIKTEKGLEVKTFYGFIN